MANTLPVAVKQVMAASGGPAPVTLLEVLTISGNLYAWSDASLFAPSILAANYSGGSGPPAGIHPEAAPMSGESIGRWSPLGSTAMMQFVPWIIKPAVITQYKSTQTDTATISVQNLTGDTIRRDASQIMASQELDGALIYLRIWNLACAYSVLDFQGNIDDVQIAADGDSMDISMQGFAAWAKVPAPREQLGSACGNIYNDGGCFFGCGAPSPTTPCNNDYGTCVSPGKNRFKGIITEWAGSGLSDSQVAQQPPLRLYNPRVAG
jgi:hypothetical protein